MPTIAPKVERKEYELVKAGTHVAIPYQILHLGTQKITFQGEDKTAYKIRISFELPNSKKVFKEGEAAKPAVISTKLTLSMFKKAKLRPLVEGVIGVTLKDDEAERFDIEEILGKPCLIRVTHDEGKDGKIYATVAGTSELMEGMAVPTQTNPNKVVNLFSSMGGKWDDEVFNSLPDFIRKEIDLSLERTKPVKKTKTDSEVEEFDADKIEYPTDEVNPDDTPF